MNAHKTFARLLLLVMFEALTQVQSMPVLPKKQLLGYRNVKDYVPLSPCPRIFQYRNHRYGFISVPSIIYNNFDTNRIQLRTSFRVGGLISNSQNTGKLELLHDWATTSEMIKMHQPIEYRIEFPRHPTTPSLVNITVNGQVVCMSNRPSNMNELFSTIRLQFGLTLPQPPHIVSPLSTDDDIDDETTEYEAPWINVLKSSERQVQSCGRIASEFRLAATDEEVKIGTWPWLVAIFVKTDGAGLTFKCTGNLLSNRIVVSAAHCFIQNRRKMLPSEFVLSFGRHNLRDWSENVRSVERIEMPVDYLRREAAPGNDSDIAILIMQEFIPYSALVRPICLWPSSNPSNGDSSTGIIVGWENPSEQTMVNVPRKIKLNTVEKSMCMPPNGQSSRILCAESMTSNAPCKGDSGNGLAVWRNGAWFLRGIVSSAFGDPHFIQCVQNQYVILTDMSRFSAWITEWINKFQYFD